MIGAAIQALQLKEAKAARKALERLTIPPPPPPPRQPKPMKPLPACKHRRTVLVDIDRTGWAIIEIHRCRKCGSVLRKDPS